MKIALLGNPNTGKSSVFNMLTGLRQQVGNFPGVTVDKRFGTLLIGGEEHTLIDFPGTYSIYPRSNDERIVFDVLNNKDHVDFPDVAVVVADQSNLERNLFLFTQIYDSGIPTVLVLNMADIAHKSGIEVHLDQLKLLFPSTQIAVTTAKLSIGKERLIKAIQKASVGSEYAPFLPNAYVCSIDDIKCQEDEALSRYERISSVIEKIQSVSKSTENSKVSKLDRLFVHPFFGYFIFAAILMIIFQFIFSFASYPMDLIDGWFSQLSDFVGAALPKGIFTDLLSQGIIPGIGGVLVFIPQIALLFFFISILEESGYLARVVFIMDRLMRPLGLNGKSVVPLLSSVACAIPGVMATRTIADRKERMITILVAPLMSCSARIPVYTLLIALVIPKTLWLGIFNLQGLVLFGLYSLGLISVLCVSLVLKWMLKSREKGFLLLELPSYKSPNLGNVGLTVWEKVKVFTLDAGKVILAISIILWALATYGPSDDMERESQKVELAAKKEGLSESLINEKVASVKLENSYIGKMGKALEPIINPLGYDWKIGVSLITSFAAREVFVGSLATIYAVHDNNDENKKLIDRLRSEKNQEGLPTYNLASGISLMIFYVFAMQCMATLAVVKRETKSWKWPLIQMGYMGVLAYVGAYIAYQIFK